MSKHEETDVSVLALVELPQGVWEGRFNVGLVPPLRPGRSMADPILWGLLAGLFSLVPDVTNFNMAVFADNLHFERGKNVKFPQGYRDNPLERYAGVYDWLWVSKNGRKEW